ncbi:zinc metalloproteinase nas-8 [Cochliomyia hominivorax]
MFRTFLKGFYLLLIALQTLVYCQNITEENKGNPDSYDNSLENPEENEGLFEGVINGMAKDFRVIVRNGIASTNYRWPYGIIPYKIEGTFSSSELDTLSHIFKEYHAKTCVRFKKRTNEKDYVAITNKNTGCWSTLGRIGGRQEVNLQSGKCFKTYGVGIHELMHVVGFYHEQNRYDRDSYVRVVKENIKPDMLVNFEKLSKNAGTNFGVPYDYASVMHYKSNSFSKNGKSTLVALKATPEASQMGQRIGFSKGDIKKIRNMYLCK